MQPADVLDAPRLLAIRATPASLGGDGEAISLEALTWAVDTELTWSSCPVAWAPTEPLSCPAGDATPLGTGNPVAAALPVTNGEVWVKVEGGEALPAVRLLKVGDAANPVVNGIAGPDGAAFPATSAGGAALEVAVTLGANEDPGSAVTSWYVTGGTLSPPRTVGVDTTTWELPAAGSVGTHTIIAVTRTTAGGVTWHIQTLEVQ